MSEVFDVYSHLRIFDNVQFPFNGGVSMECPLGDGDARTMCPKLEQS
jgi:hypothetical protein